MYIMRADNNAVLMGDCTITTVGIHGRLGVSSQFG